MRTIYSITTTRSVILISFITMPSTTLYRTPISIIPCSLPTLYSLTITIPWSICRLIHIIITIHNSHIIYTRKWSFFMITSSTLPCTIISFCMRPTSIIICRSTPFIFIIISCIPFRIIRFTTITTILCPIITYTPLIPTLRIISTCCCIICMITLITTN